MKYNILFICLLILLGSCSQKKSSINDAKDLTIAKSEILLVKLELKTTVKDEFRIMLNQIEIDEFQKMNIQASEVIPVTSHYESMKVDFFENMFSKKIVIGLGNKFPKRVEIKSISVSKGLNIIDIPQAQIEEYFTANKYVIFDDDMNITTKKIDGKHAPILFANSRLINLLTKK